MYSEALEPRRLFHGVYQGFPGYYEITSTDGDDTVSISVDQANNTFTLDGVTYVGVVHIAVFAGAGNDNVTIDSVGRGTVAAAVVGGAGRDVISAGLTAAVWGDGGNDEITLRNAFRGEAYGGEGDDYITVAGDCIECQLEGELGNDIMWALDNRYAVVLRGGAGDDRLYGSPYDDIFFDGPGSDWLFGLAGNDEFHCRDGSPDWIMGGDGFDVLWCNTGEGGINGCESINYG